VKRVNVSMPDHVFEMVEEARGWEPRSSFVTRTLESVLGGVERAQRVGTSTISTPDPEPTRAPEQSPRFVPASTQSAPSPKLESESDPDFVLPKIAPRSWAQ
jgi:hypothetical protein